MASNNDDLVIGISTDITTIKRQLRELGQSVTQATAGYSKGFESFGKSIDSAINTTGVQRRIAEITGVVQKSGKEWKGALADIPAELDAIRQKYSPLYAEQQKYLASLRDIKTAQAIGAISAVEMSAAIAAEKGAFAQRVIAINGGKKAIDESTKSFKLNRIGMMELQASGINAFQALAAGMSPFRVASMEGAQVVGAFVQGTEGIGTKILGVVTKFPLVTAGVVAAGAALATYELVGKKSIESLDDILKQHEANIKRLGPAYDEVSKHEKAYAQGDSAITVNFLNAGELKKAQELARSQLQDALNGVFRNLTLGGGFAADPKKIISAKFLPFKSAISELTGLDINNGQTSLSKIAEALQKVTNVDMSKFNSDVSQIGTLNPAAADAAHELLNLFSALDKTVNAFPQLSAQVSDADVKFAKLQQAISAIDSSSAQKALQELMDKAKNGDVGIAEVSSAISTLEGTNLTLAGPIAALQKLFAAAISARNALNPGQQLSPLGTVGPVYSGGGKFIDANDVQTARANATKSQFQIAMEKAAKHTARSPVPPHTANDTITQSIAELQGRTQELAVQRGLLGATYEEQTRVNTAYSLTSKALKDVREEARKKGDADWQNAKLTPEQIALINQKSEAYAQQADALKKAREALQETAQASRDFAQTFIDDMISGKSATEALGDALKQLGKRFEDLALNSLFGGGSGGGTGLFGQIFGSLFGGGQPPVIGGDPWLGMRANGGPVTAGMPYIVGEKRPELFVPNTSGTIIPQVPTIQAAGSGSGTTNMNLAITVAGTGDKELMANMQAAAKVIVGQAINDNNRSLPARVAKINQNPRMR